MLSIHHELKKQAQLEELWQKFQRRDGLTNRLEIEAEAFKCLDWDERKEILPILEKGIEKAVHRRRAEIARLLSPQNKSKA